MSSTLEKLRCLEAYVANDSMVADPVFDKTLSKLLAREHARMQHLIDRLQQDIHQFEQAYQLTSPEFYRRYNRGEMGDEVDFIDWAATLEMLENAQKRVNLLDAGQ